MRKTKNQEELQKNFEKTAREGLRQIQIPDLKTTGPGSNEVLWIETIRRKYNEVKKHAPGSMPRFIDTVKLSLGDKSQELACVNSFAGITSYVGRRVIKGRQWLESIIKISQMRNDHCLSSSESEKRLSLFIRNVKLLFELALQSFIMEYDMKVLPS